MVSRRPLAALALALGIALMLALPLVTFADGPVVGQADGIAAWFVENVGQFDEAVRYRAELAGETLWLTEDGLWIRQGEVVARVTFKGANPVRVEPYGPVKTRVSFFLGNDPSRWRADVPVWQGVRYVELYPGVDLALAIEGGAWTWAALPNARLSGADRTRALDQVELAVEGDVALPELSNALPLDEDPEAVVVDNADELHYATYLGGGNNEYIEDMAVDSAGRVHLVGWTQSTDFPDTPGAYDGSLDGNKDAFVCKLSADGSALEYATYFGGDADDIGHSIALDSAGNAYIAGATDSDNLPTTEGVVGAWDEPRQDAFFAKLDSSGANLLVSTYLGAGGIDHARAIDIDTLGNVYLAGYTTSEADPETPDGFPMVEGSYVQPGDILGMENVFVVKLDPTAVTVTYSIVLGTPGNERAEDLVVDSRGRAHVLGWTNHISFTTTPGDFGNAYGGSSFDTFCLQVTAEGDDLGFSRLIGGAAWDEPGGIALDRAGNVYVSGWTDSLDFPVTPGAHQTTYLIEGEDEDPKAGFVCKLDPTGETLLMGTFLGGMGIDQVRGIGVDTAGTIYVAGDTTSDDLPTTADAYDRSYNGGETWGGDAFLYALDASGATLTYGTYYGGTDADVEAQIAIARTGEIFIAGRSLSDDLPTTDGAYDRDLAGGTWGDAFVAQIGPLAVAESWRVLVPLAFRE